MTSINFNSSATTALRTLQQTNSALETTQNRVATGLKIGEAKDNAAYWAISTTLKSDNKSLSTVKDALNLGAATVDTAYQGLNKAKDVLDEIKSKLTAATQDGVDRNVIQSEIAELQKQLAAIATSSIFSGENWLSVNSGDASYSATKNIVSSFTRTADGSVSIGTIEVATGSVALFDANSTATTKGILDTAVVLNGVSVGGSNSTAGTTAGGLVAGTATAGRSTATGSTAFDGTTKPLTFDNIADNIKLSVTVDGAATPIVVDVRRATVQTALNNSASSVSIATTSDMVKVLQQAFSDAGVTGVTISAGSDGMIKYTSAKTGTTSDVAVVSTSATDDDAAGTLATDYVATDFATAGGTDVFEKASVPMLAFSAPIQFASASDAIKFTIKVNAATAEDVTITKATVNAALGTTDGKVNSASEFQQVLDYALQNDKNGDGTAASGLTANGVTVGSMMTGKVTFTSNSTASTSAIAISAVDTVGFTGTAGAAVSISVAAIDISTATMATRGADTNDEVRNTIAAYIDVVSSAIDKITTAASTLGAVSSRVELQQTFLNSLMDTIDKGVSNLVDADLSEESTKLQALQTKQQLGIQALSIANSSQQNVLRLFQ